MLLLMNLYHAKARINLIAVSKLIRSTKLSNIESASKIPTKLLMHCDQCWLIGPETVIKKLFQYGTSAFPFLTTAFYQTMCANILVLFSSKFGGSNLIRFCLGN